MKTNNDNIELRNYVDVHHIYLGIFEKFGIFYKGNARLLGYTKHFRWNFEGQVKCIAQMETTTRTVNYYKKLIER